MTLLFLNVESSARTPDYSRIDRHALNAPAEAELSVSALAQYLSADQPRSVWDSRVRFWVANKAGDEWKARAIYRWVTDRIAYRIKVPDKPVDNHEYCAPDGRYWSSVVSPQTTLVNRRAYCVSYSLLYQALASKSGLSVLYIEGHAGSDDSLAEHAWNAVKIGDEWRMVDTTWGAGYVVNSKYVKLFDGKWCLAEPKGFFANHKPFEKHMSVPCYQFMQRH